MTFKTIVRVVSTTLVMLGLTLIVRAHTRLEKTVPADGAMLAEAPADIELVFNEQPDVKLTRIELAGAAGKIETGPARAATEKSVSVAVVGKMPFGKYSVTWQTAGDDGHLVKGAFSFSIKQGQ